MKPAIAAGAAVLTTALTCFGLVGGASPAAAGVPTLPQPGSSAGQIEQFTQLSSNAAGQLNAAANDAWRRGYDTLPPQLRGAVPPQIRPAEPSIAPPPPAEPAQPDASEPTPGPDTCANCVAITFDDGPVGDTDRLLGILEQKNAPATFFVVGSNADANPAALRRMQAAGHTIGNHSYSHPEMPHLADGAIGGQLDSTSAAIKRATGVSPHWMRPPYGAYDSRVISAAGARGMAVAIWDVDTADWKYRDAERTCRVAVENSKAGSVVLMHDIHPATVDAVPCIIDGLRSKGLRLASLDQLLKNPEAGKVYTHRQ